MKILRKSIPERISDVTGFGKDVVMNIPKLVMLGDREIEINNYKGLLEYSCELIRIATTNKQIKITGESLQISGLDADTAVIHGTITGIEFLTKSKKHINDKK